MQTIFSTKTSKPKKEVPAETSKPSSAGMPLFLQAAPLQINEPGDIYEQEADRAADRVMRKTDSAPSISLSSAPRIQRCGCGGMSTVGAECAECREKRLSIQRKANGSDSGMTAPANIVPSGGHVLPTATRTHFENKFGHDFSSVRVHTSDQAAENARSINARAFTAGQDVVFGAGEYQPDTAEGQHLLAHELAHVVQQGGQRQRIQRDEAAGMTSASAPMSVAAPAPTTTTMPPPESAPAQAMPPAEEYSGMMGASRLLVLLTGIATLNPILVLNVIAGVAWETFPNWLKEQIINKLIDICLFFAQAGQLTTLLMLPLPGGLVIGGIVSAILQGFIGFLERLRSMPANTKIFMVNRFLRMLSAPTGEFMIGFLIGLVKGILDGITGPFVLLWDILGFLWSLVEMQAKLLVGITQSAIEGKLGDDIKNLLNSVQLRVGEFIDNLMKGASNPGGIFGMIGDIIEEAVNSVRGIGAQLADSLLKFSYQPDRAYGEGIGFATGIILFEVILIIVTEGGYLAVKAGVEGARAATGLGRLTAQVAEAFGSIVGLWRRFATFLRRSRVMTPIVELFEEIFVLLGRYLRFSYGIEAPAGAAERRGQGAAERGAGAAEREGSHAAEEFAQQSARGRRTVENTATGETHELTFLADGTITRCSNPFCMKFSDSIAQRAKNLPQEMSAEATAIQNRADTLTQEYRNLSQRTDLTSAEISRMSDLEREMETVERQMADVEARARQAVPAQTPEEIAPPRSGEQALGDIGEEIRSLPSEQQDRLMARIVRGDAKGRKFGTPRNARMPTIEEFNPRIQDIHASDLEKIILDTKHGITPEQAQSIGTLSDQELLRFRIQDPISGAGNSKQMLVTGGHHRIAEIISRVKSGKMSSDTIVRILFHD